MLTWVHLFGIDEAIISTFAVLLEGRIAGF